MNVSSKLEFEAPYEILSQETVLSADKDILSRRSVAIIPKEGSAFGYDINSAFSNDQLQDRLVFHISDSQMDLDLNQSYINLDFQAIVTNSADVALDAFLDHGGIMSCIREVNVNIGGVNLESINDFNKYYNACVNFPKHSEQYRDLVLHSAGDSVNDIIDGGGDPRYRTITQTAAAFTSATSTLTLTGSAATSELKIGDRLQLFREAVDGTASQTFYCIVTSITSDTVVLVSGLTADITVIKKVTLIERDAYEARRKYLVNNGTNRVSFKQPSGS